MSAELRVKFLGEYSDARDALTALSRLLNVATAASGLHHRETTRRWQFAHLSLGSVEAGVVPAPGSADDSEVTFDEIVDGLVDAERDEGVPHGWTEQLTRTAWEMLSSATDEGVLLQLLRRGSVVRSARVTRTARRNLEAALNAGHRESIGSVIGQLDTVSVHENRRARLWPERGGASIEVRFAAEFDDQVRQMLGRRVQARGLLRRSGFDEIKYMTLRRLDRLPAFDESPPLSGLVGLDPDFTGGLSVDDYLRTLRG